MERKLPALGRSWRLLARNTGLALALVALAVFLYYDVQTIYVLLKFAIVDHGAQADWVNLVGAAERADPYAVVDAGFRWSPVAAWLLKPVVAGGWWVFVAAHFAVLALIRDWRVVVLMLAWWPFWNDVVHGNVVTFAFVAAWLALAGSRRATWTFYAMALLMPRPIMLPVLAWLLWKRPETRLAFAAIFVVHAALVLRSGLGDEWIARLLITAGSEMLHPANFGPTRFLGAAWIPFGVLLAAILIWRGRIGLASVAAQPYLFPYYMMFVLLELRPTTLTMNGRGSTAAVTSDGKWTTSHGGFVRRDPRSGFSAAADARHPAWLPERQLIVRIFFLALGGLLAGYMFLGRGFAHISIGPVYIGDWILFVGVATAVFVAIRARVRVPVTWTVALLLAFVALGALRTLPYLETYGMDALRDGALWGYAAFALIVYLLADRTLILSAFRLYGWVVPIFALWLPISWNLFAIYSAASDPTRPGSVIPLVFFKGGDMAVHTVGAVAFLVIGAASIQSARTFVWRVLICLPLLWTSFVAGTSNRGALLTATVGIFVVAILAWRSRNWLPLLAATGIFVIAAVLQGAFAAPSGSARTPIVELTPLPSGSPRSSPTVQPAGSPSGLPAASLSIRPSDGAADATSAPEAQPGNRLAIANSGFELGPLNGGTIEGWTTRGAGSHNIVAGSAYRGDRFASVQNVAQAYEDTITSSRIPFKDGPDIAVSVWVKAIAARPILEIYVNWYDGSGTLISSVFLNSLATDGVRTWQECAGALAAPANTTAAEIVFYEASGKATIGIDEVAVTSGHFPDALPKGRPATLQQMFKNLFSIFGSSSDGGLEGSKQFRLAWWGKIVDYTVFGKYFWTGKGFGVNLADADGFQSTADGSLRSPHNSEMTVLARMGVPGLILWVLVQAAFGIGLLRATLAHRRGGDTQLAVIGGLVVAYWVAMMVDTSFDPYLEGPQGGIWFWAIFGLGLLIMKLAPRRPPA